MIQIVSMFSLVLLMFTACINVLAVKSNLNKELKKCLVITTQINRKRRATLKHLFSLNTKASMLRTQRTVAEKAYKAAPTPPLRAVAFTALQAVKLLQKTFRAYQKTIITKLNLHSTSFITKTASYKAVVIKHSLKPMIKAYPKRSSSPSYKTTRGFTKKTEVFIQKDFGLGLRLPSYFSGLLSKKKGFVECGSVLIKKGGNSIKLNLLGGKSF